MKILSVFSLLVATNADFKASPVCIAGTTCVGFGVTLTGVLAAQEAFHSNHEVPKSASDSKGGPELGSFFDDDLQVGDSCGGLRRLDSDGVHRRLACAKGLSCTSTAAPTEIPECPTACSSTVQDNQGETCCQSKGQAGTICLLNGPGNTCRCDYAPAQCKIDLRHCEEQCNARGICNREKFCSNYVGHFCSAPWQECCCY